MGAWSVGPFGNDRAQDWVWGAVIVPVSNAIELAIRRATADPADDGKKAEAEAAICLLVSLAEAASLNVDLRMPVQSRIADQGLLLEADAALRTLLADETALASWNDPEQKAAALNALQARIAAIVGAQDVDRRFVEGRSVKTVRPAPEADDLGGGL